MLNLSKGPVKEGQIQYLELWRNDSKSFSCIRSVVFGKQTFSASFVLEQIHKKILGALMVGESHRHAGELDIAPPAISPRAVARRFTSSAGLLTNPCCWSVLPLISRSLLRFFCGRAEV